MSEIDDLLVYEPTPPGEVRDPEAMDDEPPFIWGPGE